MLSGGERNRLLLARLFARPANVLVLDEPTNDLDIESLELLEETLQGYPGTLLLVSHDRAFLDNVVTQTLAPRATGDGASTSAATATGSRSGPHPVASRAQRPDWATRQDRRRSRGAGARRARSSGLPSSVTAKAVSSSCCRNRSRHSRPNSRRCTRAWPSRVSPGRARGAQGRSRAHAGTRARTRHGVRALGGARRPRLGRTLTRHIRGSGALLVRCDAAHDAVALPRTRSDSWPDLQDVSPW